jgi:hypothetical protein
MTDHLFHSLQFCTVSISDCSNELQNVQKSNADVIIRNLSPFFRLNTNLLCGQMFRIYFSAYISSANNP